jgi:hypothetical protein
MFSIVGLFEETKRRREKKKEWIKVNNIEIHCICVGTRHNETH